MAIGDLSDLLNDSKYLTVVTNNIQKDNLFNNLVNNPANMKQNQESITIDKSNDSLPDLTDSDVSNDEAFDDVEDYQNDHHNENSENINAKNNNLIEKSGSNSDISIDSTNSSNNSNQKFVNEAFDNLFINDSSRERQIVISVIVRIIANLLITKFPIDDCCNNKNNLMVTNLTVFFEKLLNRSRLPLNQFLIANLYLFKILDKMNKIDLKTDQKYQYKNNDDKLCLRRLIITSFIIGNRVSQRNKSSIVKNSKLNNKNITKNSANDIFKQRILNQNFNTQTWSIITGLKVEELTKLTDNFSRFLSYDFNLRPSELNKYKDDLKQLVKFFIKTELSN